jgi:hypothetical protein
MSRRRDRRPDRRPRHLTGGNGDNGEMRLYSGLCCLRYLLFKSWGSGIGARGPLPDLDWLSAFSDGQGGMPRRQRKPRWRNSDLKLASEASIRFQGCPCPPAPTSINKLKLESYRSMSGLASCSKDPARIQIGSSQIPDRIRPASPEVPAGAEVVPASPTNRRHR